jgi:hypothetical protein
MKPVYGATRVAMKPRTVSAEGYVKTEWKLRHDEVVYETNNKSLTIVALWWLMCDEREFVVD